MIFINYRNSDEPYAAALIDQDLCRRFGARNVFRASRSIPVGIDFEQEVRDRLAQCRVLIAVIGQRW
ncbi:MAG TPA: TIR domain-containing protein, partial [Micromonosporaceae bacterium]